MNDVEYVQEGQAFVLIKKCRACALCAWFSDDFLSNLSDLVETSLRLYEKWTITWHSQRTVSFPNNLNNLDMKRFLVLPLCTCIPVFKIAVLGSVASAADPNNF